MNPTLFLREGLLIIIESVSRLEVNRARGQRSYQRVEDVLVAKLATHIRDNIERKLSQKTLEVPLLRGQAPYSAAGSRIDLAHHAPTGAIDRLSSVAQRG